MRKNSGEGSIQRLSLIHIYALIFDRLKSRSVRVYSPKSGRGLRMDFEGFDYFGIWSSLADAPLICVEPWTGTATQESEDDVFERKQGKMCIRDRTERCAFNSRLPCVGYYDRRNRSEIR